MIVHDHVDKVYLSLCNVTQKALYRI